MFFKTIYLLLVLNWRILWLLGLQWRFVISLFILSDLLYNLTHILYFRLISFQCCAPFKFNFIFLWTLHELHRLLRHKRLSSFLWRSSGKEAHKIAKNRISSIYSRLNLFGLRSFNSLIRLEDKLILFKVFFVVSFNASNLFLWCF